MSKCKICRNELKGIETTNWFDGLCEKCWQEKHYVEYPFKKGIYEKDQQIADLEAKLEERTEQLKIALKDFNDIQQENAKITQQLAEKEKEEPKRMEDFEKGCQEYYKSNQTEIAELKNQLSEKDELLKQKIGDMKSTDFIKMCIKSGFIVKAKENDNQTAIRELEKVKGFLLEKIAEKQSCFDSGNYNDFADGVKTICELMLISIDNQINELKEGY